MPQQRKRTGSGKEREEKKRDDPSILGWIGSLLEELVEEHWEMRLSMEDWMRKSEKMGKERVARWKSEDQF